MSDLQATDRIKDFPTVYNNDIQTITNELHFRQDGEGEIKYTGVVNVSGDIHATGTLSGDFTGTVTASNVILSGGNNVEDELANVMNLNNAILDQSREFERRADLIRKITPSGFSEFGDYIPGWIQYPLSSSNGLFRADEVSNRIYLSGVEDITVSSENSKVVINGYNIILKGISPVPYNTTVKFNAIDLPSPPTSGTRQDLVFIEAWKEEVDKETGLFFPFGNTQYAGSNDVDGTVISQVQAGYTGSAYFTSNDDVYCVRATSATEAFFANSDNNIGILDNGNYFQVRYRIRVEEDISVQGFDNFYDVDYINVIRAQGQYSSVGTRGSSNIESTIGLQISSSSFPVQTTINDNGLYIGGDRTGGANVPLQPISGLSLDGFTYAIPVCAIHRRNTGVYSLANLNGTAFEDSWIVSKLSNTGYDVHGSQEMTLITVGSSTFKVVNHSTDAINLQLVRVSGTETPEGTGTWSHYGNPQTDTLTIISVDDGRFMHNISTRQHTRPDSLYSDIIDRRDVLDLRHKVSLTGHLDEDLLYQDTYDTMMKGEYRQEWEQQKAFDADGNGLELIESGIYGNVITESVAFGQTVPDAHINTHLTKVTTCTNGTQIGFNGARTVFSDAETNEDYSAIMLDHSVSGVLDSEDGIVTYNSISKTITIDMTNHSSYINSITNDPTLLGGHLPKVRWGNSNYIDGIWTRTSDYIWSFEAKEYGHINIIFPIQYAWYKGTVITDAGTGLRWICQESATSVNIFFLPDYANGNDGSVLPTGNVTWISGIGNQDLKNTTTSNYWSGNSIGFGKGYSNSAHGTLATESIFAKFKINYKAGSSCLTELPYGDNLIKGAEVFISGVKIPLPTYTKTTNIDKDTKMCEMKALLGNGPLLSLGSKAITPCVLFHSGIHKMWYIGNNDRIHYAESTDGGITWEQFQGAGTDGCVVDHGTSGKFDEIGAQSSSIIIDGATYKMLYTGLISGTYRVGYATSTDGKTWTKVAGAGIGDSVMDIGDPGAGWADAHVGFPSLMKDGATYKAWVSGLQAGVWRIGYATSTDMINWTWHSGQVLDISVSVNDDDDFYATSVLRPNVIKDGNIYKMFYESSDGVIAQVGYATSKDGRNWNKQGKVISSPRYTNYPGSTTLQIWDYHHNTTPCVIKEDGAYKIWYGAYSVAGIWSIGYGVLAMSQPGATGTSLTGTYTNTDPQINLGFRSSDSVVLHYERLAKQCHQNITVGDGLLDIKGEAILTNTGTNTGNSTLINYTNFYMTNWTNGAEDKPYTQSETISDVTLKNAREVDGIYYFDIDELIGGKKVYQTSTSPMSDAYSYGGSRDKIFTAIHIRMKDMDIYKMEGNDDYPYIAKETSLSVYVPSLFTDNDSNRLYFRMGRENFCGNQGEGDRNIRYFAECPTASLLDLIGRPLKK
jgi:hypothetical protein